MLSDDELSIAMSRGMREHTKTHGRAGLKGERAAGFRAVAKAVELEVRDRMSKWADDLPQYSSREHVAQWLTEFGGIPPGESSLKELEALELEEGPWHQASDVLPDTEKDAYFEMIKDRPKNPTSSRVPTVNELNEIMAGDRDPVTMLFMDEAEGSEDVRLEDASGVFDTDVDELDEPWEDPRDYGADC